MKKIIAMILCFVMLGAALVSCADKEDPGAEITLYMDSITNLDPALAYNDATATQILSLVYDGLVEVDEKGKVQESIAKTWTLDDNVLEFRLNETKWSDGTVIQAKDFVYAWKRILDPEFQCSAASLLMYIKNAKEVKNGDTSIDNLGLYASGTNLLTVELIDGAYADAFLQNCASIALSPLREDKVEKIKIEPDPLYKEALEATEGYVQPAYYSWASISSVMLANGPFYVKEFSYGDMDGKTPGVILERNKYYYYDSEKEEALQKYVVPYRLNILFTDSAEAFANYKKALAGEKPAVGEDGIEPMGYGKFMNNLPLEERKGQKANANVNDLLSTYSYLFNTAKEPFNNPKVTKALSMALDRSAIVSSIVFGKAATGLLTDAVMYTDRDSSFRETAGSLLSTKADVAGAKKLLSEAGVSGGEFTITVRKGNKVELAVANAAAESWKQLGFTVTVKEEGVTFFRYFEFKSVAKDPETGKGTGYEFDYVYANLVQDNYLEAINDGKFDVVGIDLSMMSADPFSVLAQFAQPFSGGAYDFTESAEHFELIPGATGYASAKYDELIDKALKEKDAGKRADLLKQAEKLLLEDAPIAPVYFMQSGSLIHEDLDKYEIDYAGNYDFTKLKDTSYEYVPDPVALIPVKYWD